MNLNDCINRLPLILRGRFSSSSNSTWLAWAADCIKAVERVSIGPGNKRKVQAWQMTSGFVPMPTPLCQITDAWLDGVRVDGLQEKDDRGFLTSSTATFKKIDIKAKSYGYTADVDVLATGISFPTHRVVKVKYLASSGSSSITVDLVSGEKFDTTISSTKYRGWDVVISGTSYYILSGSSSDGITASLNLDGTIPDPLSAGTLLDLYGFNESDLDGGEVHVDSSILPIQDATFVNPNKVSGSWGSNTTFSCELSSPARIFTSLTDGIFVKSNLVVEGYRRLARPSTLTELLDLPEGSEPLMAAYLRWAAENDQDMASSEALKAKAAFDELLRKYAIDQSRTDGATRPTAYQFTPKLTGRRP